MQPDERLLGQVRGEIRLTAEAIEDAEDPLKVRIEQLDELVMERR